MDVLSSCLHLRVSLLDGKLLPAFTSPLYATLARKEYGCGELTFRHRASCI